MWNTICTDARVGFYKSLFGLLTKVVYKPTGSPIVAKVWEYSHADGARLRSILKVPADALQNAVGDFRPSPSLNGNFLAEVCFSQDKAFVAVQLLQFSEMTYVPVTEPLIFEGKGAFWVAKLFI